MEDFYKGKLPKHTADSNHTTIVSLSSFLYEELLLLCFFLSFLPYISGSDLQRVYKLATTKLQNALDYISK